MKIIEVLTEEQKKAFVQLNVQLNKSTPNYIQPLYKDVNAVFDTKINKTYRNGEVVQYMLLNDGHEAIGRVAAFTNSKYKNKGDNISVGGIGFFDCINNQAAANLLFDTAKAWLSSKGVQAMDGPINFGERDKWWGLVVQGFHEPLYNMNFNPEYYVSLFETYGFQPFYYQLCFGLDPQKPLSTKITERYNALIAQGGYSAAHVQLSNINKYAEDFTTVYNKAWAGHGGLKQLALAQVKLMFAKMKPIIDEDILWFAYHNMEPIGMFVNIPDLNQYFKHFKGKFGLLQKLEFVYRQRFKRSTKFNGLVFGIVPEQQGKGVDALLIEAARQYIQLGNKSLYTAYEMQWIGDFNPKMVNIASTLGDTFVNRKLCTYRYLFDRKKEFVRHPMLA